MGWIGKTPGTLLAIDACRSRIVSFSTFIPSAHFKNKTLKNEQEMADAAAAREARRKAILSRGNDRLNKLASSARGEDYVANVSKSGMHHIAMGHKTFTYFH